MQLSQGDLGILPKFDVNAIIFFLKPEAGFKRFLFPVSHGVWF